MRKKTPVDEIPSRNTGRVARNRMRIAWMYYVEGMTQSEIGDALGIGRVTVIRNINEAIKQHDVKIWITGQVAECLSYEKELKLAFNLKDAIVAPEPANGSTTAKVVGAAAGMYVSEQLHNQSCIGVGWGVTLNESLQTLTRKDLNRAVVISLLGGIVQAKRFNPSEFAWQFSSLIGADCYLLAAPALVDSPKTRQALLERCGLNDVLAHGEKMDMALLSVGAMSAHSTAFRLGFLTDEERLSLIKKGAVGDLLYNFFNAEGRLVKHTINQRVVSMPIEKLKSVPRRVLISGGTEKVAAILGGIKLVHANVLITSENTAKELLRQHAAQSSR